MKIPKTSQVILSVALFILVAFAGVITVSAQDSAGTGSSDSSGSSSSRALSRASASESRSAAREERVEERCSRVGERVDALIQRYEENKERHVARYESIANRVGDLLARVEEAGYDTTEVRLALNKMIENKQAFVARYTNFIASLEESKQYACGDSEGQFVNALQSAREQLQLARQEAVQARETANTQLREALDNLRAEIAANES